VSAIDQWAESVRHDESYYSDDTRFASPTKHRPVLVSPYNARSHDHNEDLIHGLHTAHPAPESSQETPKLTFAARKKERLFRAQREAMSAFQGTPLNRIADSTQSNRQGAVKHRERSPSHMRVT
jgi:hypothetical protein